MFRKDETFYRTTAEERAKNRGVREYIDSTTVNQIVDGDGSTPLIAAIAEGKLESVMELIRLGADVNIANFHGLTPLLTAALADWPEVIQFLVDAGADLEYSYRGDTALVLASQRGHSEVVKILLELGADINIRKRNLLRVHRLHSTSASAWRLFGREFIDCCRICWENRSN